ncbi:type IV B pilus protein [Pusillimonas sp. T7-7]|uniref:ATPase, T2SS/T4P/T4SS family n=1 Tax=Pusillimonas sp. (strain T7-7) TaxID=1007105 RepID=UPI0002084C4F|nr:ATPase, T2SS/T4P/T4SS family [Pusillimonas sp. T7-7]AEC18864.1 type IV B pilus protein [Pusillimonas sp. T7-7]
MKTKRLAQAHFVDIVLGPDFCDVKIEGPTVIEARCVEDEFAEDVRALRELCLQRHKYGAEFTIQYDTLRFRATTMEQDNGPIWFLSRIDAQVRPLSELPVPRRFATYVLRPRLHGLILVTGGFGAGKTTTASSLFAQRIATLGGTGIALEDPTAEVQMGGRQGAGRVLQFPVTRHEGGYHTALQLVRRSRANLVFVGEIRDALTAVEAQDIANTDMPVIATMHASSIEEAFDKYQAYMRSRHSSSAEANARLAMSVAGIIHLTKQYVPIPDQDPEARYQSRSLILDHSDPACTGAIGKIRQGNFVGLGDEITQQAARDLSGI